MAERTNKPNAGGGRNFRGQHPQGSRRTLGEAAEVPQRHGGLSHDRTPRPHLEVLRGKGGT